MRCFKYCSGLIDEKPMIPFLVLLLPKTYKEKTWIFSNRNHRFTPLKKSLFSREASFIFNTSLNIISGLILTKKKKRKTSRFFLYQNRGLTLLEKSLFGDFEKLTFL